MDSSPPTLGVDIGGVIIDRVADGTDTSLFGKNYKRTPAVAGAFNALARLNAGRFASRELGDHSEHLRFVHRVDEWPALEERL